MPHSTQTIVAVSSPPGASLRGLVRLSGPGCRDVAAALLAPIDAQASPTTAPAMTEAGASASSTLRLPSHRLTPCRLRLADLALPVVAAFFAAPASYTGDDILELQVPGNPALLERTIQAILALGPRLAEPGEFTFRAYLAGKLDLTQAEGIAATIAATSDAQLAAADHLRRGELGTFASRLVDALATNLALVEAGIDFVDQDDVTPIAPGPLDTNLAAVETKLADLLTHSRAWGELQALPRVVLVGPPSVGKSTLFNALLGRRRAVTSPMPGTTRDLLAEPLQLRTAAGQRIEVMLIDMAGLDEAIGTIASQMQSLARQTMAQADLLLLLDDGSAAATPPLPIPANIPALRIRTKVDRPAPSPSHRQTGSAGEGLAVSATTGAGLEELRHRLADRLSDRGVSVTGEMLALQPRHEAALCSAQQNIAAARQRLKTHLQDTSLPDPELIAGSLRAALDDLASLGGQMTPDDVIGRIFATFCVGK